MVISMLKRKIYTELLKWKNESKGSSALLIEGARRVGKTKIAETFGENEFIAYKTIDFSVVSSDVISCFNDLSKIEIFFERLFLSLGINVLPKGSLLIFDEVQFCPKARQAIKTLVADGRYYYLETPSSTARRWVRTGKASRASSRPSTPGNSPGGTRRSTSSRTPRSG